MSLQFKKIHVCIKIVELKASSSSSPKLSVSAVAHSEPNEEYNLRNRTVSRESKNAHARKHTQNGPLTKRDTESKNGQEEEER